MTVGETRGIYCTQLKEYSVQKFILAQQKQELDKKIKTTENGAIVYANEAATLELNYNAVSEKLNEYQDYIHLLREQWDAKFNKVAVNQQDDAAEEHVKELGKIMTVARRIMHGDIVPQTDEKKLMEFDSDLYQMAKNAGMMARVRERQKHESLWEDEEKKEYEDPAEAADSQEVSESGPEIVSVEDTMSVVSEDTTDFTA